MLESPELRWSFIRKVYSIVVVQLLLTVVNGVFVVSYHPIVTFLTTTRGGLRVTFFSSLFHSSLPESFLVSQTFDIIYRLKERNTCHG
ncbi:hypothetical protein L6452_15599 [Arctium lappa]|uniref:Uncharacterized protein n=1 Tax=Arctium lappa TaxID=4217 RepID=A0ACB9CP54_ARCLA|nr:hypothetical protein L6452_15599 [Arctium lappa]